MNVFRFFGIIFGTARRLSAKSKRARSLSTLPMPELVREWIASQNIPGVWTASLRAPSHDGVALAESRLGFSLPPQLRSFYEICDGVESQDSEHPYPFVAVRELKPTASYSPPLSAQIAAQWTEWGEADGDPRALRVFPPGYLAAVTDRHEREVEFSFVDNMLALQPPEGGRCICILISEKFTYPPGTVFEIENLTATRHDSLASWLATCTTHV